MSLPGADELFRATTHDDELATSAPDGSTVEPSPAPDAQPVQQADQADPQPDAASGESAADRAIRQASGRVKHDEKMTVYVTADELLEIEHARLSLRRSLGGAVDRGRVVRAAVAMALADLDQRGPDSELARRLRDGS